MASKRQLLVWHRRIGLVFAFFLVLQAITGSVLVLQAPLEDLLAPELQLTRSAHPLLPIERQIAMARAARPDDILVRAIYPERTEEAPRFLFQHQIARTGGNFFMLALDPRTGAVLREGGFRQWPIEFVRRLHATLLGGPAGQVVLGLEGVVLVALVVLGWRLWWPGRQRLQAGFGIARGGGVERLLRSLHRAGGAGAALLILPTAITGMAMCWLPHARPSFETARRAPHEPSLKSALETWSRTHPGAHPARLLFTSGLQAPFQVDWRGHSNLLLDASRVDVSAKGYVLAPEAPNLAMSVLSRAIISFHSGRALGPVGTLLTLAAASFVTFLSASGIWARALRSRKL